MLGVTPADEERGQAARHLFNGQAPPEHRSGGHGPLTVDHVAWVVAAAAGRGDGRVDVVAGKRPCRQPAVAYVVDPEGTRLDWLRLSGVGRDDLQVRLIAEREQRVVGAQPDMPASGSSPDAEAFLYVGDRCREAGNGVDQVVDQHVILNSVRAAQVEPLLRRWVVADCTPTIEGNHRRDTRSIAQVARPSPAPLRTPNRMTGIAVNTGQRLTP